MDGNIIIAIDPSLSCTAVVGGRIAELGEVYASKTFSSKAVKGEINAIGRYEGLAWSAAQWIRDSFSGPLSFYIEGYSYGSAFNREVLAEYRSILYQALRDGAGARTIKQITPSSLKVFVAGNGHATKEEMIEAVERLWGVSCTTSDEADAYGIFRIALCLEGQCEPSGGRQKEALDKILAPKPKKSRKKKPRRRSPA